MSCEDMVGSFRSYAESYLQVGTEKKRQRDEIEVVLVGEEKQGSVSHVNGSDWRDKMVVMGSVSRSSTAGL